jgi:DDE superfamily endonuclease
MVVHTRPSCERKGAGQLERVGSVRRSAQRGHLVRWLLSSSLIATACRISANSRSCSNMISAEYRRLRAAPNRAGVAPSPTIDVGARHLLCARCPINGEGFRTYIEKILVPELQPGEIVFMDNLPCHKAKAIRQAIRSAGARLFFFAKRNSVIVARTAALTFLCGGGAVRRGVDPAFVEVVVCEGGGMISGD